MKIGSGAIVSLLLWYLPIAFVQFTSGRITKASITSIDPWYEDLEKGWWSPPDWLFSPVWSVLYLMMALAVWMVYRSKTERKQKRSAYLFFFAQLFANALWSFLFFQLQMPGWALVDLTLLIILIAVTALYFFRLRPVAALLLIPYLLWCIYALSLNAAIWWLN